MLEQRERYDDNGGDVDNYGVDSSPQVHGSSYVGPHDYSDSKSRQFEAPPVRPVQAMTQQATRHARRIFVGGLPPTANEQSVATFFSQVMAAVGGNTAGPGDAVVNVYRNHTKKFALVEMRSVEEASNGMALDGILFEGVPVKVMRPSDYRPLLAATLGPSQPNPNMNLAAVGLTLGPSQPNPNLNFTAVEPTPGSSQPNRRHLNLAAVGLTPGSAGGLVGPDWIFVGGRGRSSCFP